MHLSGAGIGNYLRCKLTKHHFTLFLCIVSSVSLACFAYAGLLKLGEILFGISVQHEAGYICAMLFIIPGFPFITSGIDLAKLDMRSGIERLTVCFDRYSGSYYVSMDHGTDPAFETCRFYETFTVNRAVDLIQASCKLSAECLDSLSCLTARFVWQSQQPG